MSPILVEIKNSSLEVNTLNETESPETTLMLAPNHSLTTEQGNVDYNEIKDSILGQTLAALQVLKVIEADALPGDTRREYARWLVLASSALSKYRHLSYFSYECKVSKVYHAMYIENVPELAFDDITAEDPDFSSIQG
ncbi:hypothetical protein V6N11_022177 [Hibiscus sabdariffa]|uniref:Uncharacterized protein n=1 Tax=Hibiscus sabdariffa TaxID=183260 RepID=A0ABR2TIE0_9ROSI